MPRLEIVRYYRCVICNKRRDGKVPALQCENRGLAIPEFFEKQLVSATIVQTVAAVIYGEYSEDNDPHRLPNYYEIFVRDAKALTEIKSKMVVVCRDNIRPIRANEIVCPFCLSQNLSAYTEKIFSPFCYPWFYLKNVKIMKCSDCGMRYLSDNQKTMVEAQIAAWLQKKSKKYRIADTKKLIKNDEFYS